MTTHMHHGDVLWIVLVSILFLLLFSHLGGPDKVEPKAPPPAILANFRAFQSLKERDRRSRLQIRPFRKFKDLPAELQLHILSFASRQTFLALALASKDIRRKTYIACIPRIPILLTTREKLLSFNQFCENNPEDKVGFPGVAKLVRHLWISPYEAEDRFPSCMVLKRCLNIKSLACNAWLLTEGVCSQDELKHQQCRFLTLLMPSEQNWERHFRPQMRKSRGAFFEQLTRMQVEGDVLVPRRISCINMTHLSFVCAPGWKKEGAAGLAKLVKDAKRYPMLENVVVTQRKPEGHEKVVIVGEANLRPRVVVYCAPDDAVDVKHWDVDEGVDVWERAEEVLRRTTRSTTT